ncbi:hypothetical protein Droror1_Dr00015247 [Drosera rotundifolia]
MEMEIGYAAFPCWLRCGLDPSRQGIPLACGPRQLWISLFCGGPPLVLGFSVERLKIRASFLVSGAHGRLFLWWLGGPLLLSSLCTNKLISFKVGLGHCLGLNGSAGFDQVRSILLK